MGLFERLNPKFFKPLVGRNRVFFAEILSLIWEQARRSNDYSMDKLTMTELVESYFFGLAMEFVLDEQEENGIENSEVGSRDPHAQALWFLGRLRETGWLEDLESGYEEDVRTALVQVAVPLLQAFEEIIHPKTVTYSGKLFKAYQLLRTLEDEQSPYENILKEVSSAMDELNGALRNLNASIGNYIEQLTRNKTPQQVLDLFEQYEEKIVVAAYHRFKTSDNMFYYRVDLQNGMDSCEDAYLDALIADYCNVEQVTQTEALAAVRQLIQKIRDDLDEMRQLILEIDKNHIIYRTRAVQRAQFMLLTDGSAQGRINDILRYYSETIVSWQDLLEEDDSPFSQQWKLYPVALFGERFLKPPVTSRKPTPIEPLCLQAPLEEAELLKAQQLLWDYARSAITQENVNKFAASSLAKQNAVRASTLAQQSPEEFIKVIALHTYSNSGDRNYEIEPLTNWVQYNGFKFQEFLLKKKV